ncbi:dnaJ homolog subfamily C member 13-like [Diaphorina citri]|uniref:DnaJ homolog subfamily C member 13-like n=1 Tax=Diaphorina citri TaxID=121845 RepID=A0A3Q0JLE1_DIACI|nr:dnaJ homolog subfamily C member 13-like [Diaphorina citri]
MKEKNKVEGFKHHWSESRNPVILVVTSHSLDQMSSVPGSQSEVLGSYPFNTIEAMHTVSDLQGGFVIVCKPFGRMSGAGLIMRALIEEGEPETARRLQHLALCEAALPRHLLAALFSGSDRSDTMHRQLSRHLIGLWVTDNEAAHALLSRILPLGLLQFLESDEEVPPDAVEEDVELRDNLKLAVDHATRNQRNPHLVKIERHIKTLEKSLESALQHWSVSLGLDQSVRPGGGASTGPTNHKDRPIVLRKRRERVKASANWKLFYYKFAGNHSLPSLIWNHKTREELREALEKELRAFYADRDNMGAAVISWNHHEFEVVYSSLQDGIFAENKEKLILSAIQSLLQKEGDQSESSLSPAELEAQFHTMRRLVACRVGYAAFTSMPSFRDAVGLKVVKALNRENEAISHASVDMLCALMHPMHDESSDLRQEQLNKSCLLSNHKFLDALLNMWIRHVTLGTGALVVSAMSIVYNQYSDTIGLFPDIRCVILMLARTQDKLERDRLVIFLDKLLDFKENVKIFLDENGDQTQDLGIRSPLTFFNNLYHRFLLTQRIDMKCQCLQVTRCYPTRDEDGAVIWPLPKVKRCLSHSTVLPHIVQTLLTFDPALVEQVATLLCEIVVDNALARKLYLTGVFFFILMYTGSNVLPIARFLKLTHTQQAFISDELTSSDLLKRSILGPLLPEAMLYYLENHGPEKFAQIFLGEIASQYHPDKNPGGRDIFVRANKAYDFLCSRTCWQNNDPNPNNIVLVLRTQSILFHRYSEELSGYKYAGYRQLITTIRAETSDENEALFGGSTEHDSLLQAAVELAYHTVQCSALNAQELNNEGGFQTLHVAFTRCMSVLSNSLKGNEMPVLVCSYVVKCYTVAAQFTGCRSTFTAMCPSLLRDLAAILRFPRLARLAADTAQCLGSLAIDGSLRDAMLDTSVVWSLLTFMFSYDYTLEECEVERDPDQNQQVGV